MITTPTATLTTRTATSRITTAFKFKFAYALVSGFGLSLGLSLSATPSFAQPNPADIAAIKSMEGCFEVEYEYQEVATRTSGEPGSPPYYNKSLEWITRTGDLSFLHLLLTGDPANPVFKHFTLEWLYEPSQILEFMGENLWVREPFDRSLGKNSWVARTYQVDDSPRYDCVGAWSQDEGTGKNRFDCAGPAPLPTREKKRTDYTVLDRKTQYKMTETGWVEEEDNRKINTRAKRPHTIAAEEGSNTYVKVDNSRCEQAEIWWKAHSPVWDLIHSVWKEVYAEHEVLQFKNDVPPLFLDLRKLAEENAPIAGQEDFDRNSFTVKARALIEDHLVNHGDIKNKDRSEL